MLEHHFYFRLLLLVFFGAFFVVAFMRMARHNPNEERNVSHRTSKVIGAIFAVLAVLCCIMACGALSQVNFPDRSIEPGFSEYMILRTAETKQIWGNPTFFQMQVFIATANTFACLAVAVYCHYFRSSNTNVWIKAGKILLCLFLYMLLVNATNLQYFDTYELIWPILYTIIIAMIFWFTKNRHKEACSAKKPKMDSNEVVTDVNL